MGAEGITPGPDMVNEINEAGKDILTEVGERDLSALAFRSLEATDDEVTAARAELISRGLDPTIIDELNRRRDLDNPLSGARSFEIMDAARRAAKLEKDGE